MIYVNSTYLRRQIDNACYTFIKHPDKSVLVTTMDTLFDGALSLFQADTNKIANKINTFDVTFRGVLYNDYCIYTNPSICPGYYYLGKQDPYFKEEELATVVKDFKAISEDIDYVVKCLSIVISNSAKGDNKDSINLSYLPIELYNFIAMKNPNIRDRTRVGTLIPKGKKEMWDNFSRICDYYIGLNMVM